MGMISRFCRLVPMLLLGFLLIFSAPVTAGTYGQGQYGRNPYGRTTVSCTKVADLNGDCTVTIFDLSILLSRYNSIDSTADINKNGKVDITDLSILLSNYGK